jgi:hypothetical protein
MTKSKFQIFFLFLAVWSLAVTPALADWQAPASAPPTCVAGSPGCDAPVNTGTVTQLKSGAFGVLSGFSVAGLTTLLGGLKVSDGAAATGTVLTNVGGGLAAWLPSTGGSGGGFWTAAGLSSPNAITNTNSGTVVLGTTNNPLPPLDPANKLEVLGRLYVSGLTTLTTLKLPGGAAGKVLTSDATGLGTWQSPSGGGVSKIIAGTNVTISPTSGVGDVTINATGGGGGGTVGGTGTANYLPKWATNSTLGNSLLYQNGSLIGVNTTNPTATFEVAGTGGFNALGVAGNTNIGGNANVSGNIHVAEGQVIDVRDPAHGITYNSGLDGLELRGYSGFSFRTQVGNERLKIDSGGNVGLNESSPQTRLQLTELGNVDFGTMIRLFNNSPSGDGAKIEYTKGGLKSWTAGILSGASNASFGFSEDGSYSALGTPRLTLAAGGNVIIGTATANSPAKKLDVDGDVLANNGYLFDENGNDTGLVHGNDGQVFLRSNGGDAVKVVDASNVEINGHLKLPVANSSLTVNGPNND